VGGAGVGPALRFLVPHGGGRALADQALLHLGEAGQQGQEHPAHGRGGGDRLPAVVDQVQADPGPVPGLHRGQAVEGGAEGAVERHHHDVRRPFAGHQPQQRRPARPGGQRPRGRHPLVADALDQRQPRRGAVRPHARLLRG
jgi:hypothetical protein